MELVLNSDEQQLLMELLERRHRELQTEITHTDHREFKASLRQREKVIESLLGRLRAVSEVEVRH
jgi:hypothetical protein